MDDRERNHVSMNINASIEDVDTFLMDYLRNNPIPDSATRAIQRQAAQWYGVEESRISIDWKIERHEINGGMSIALAPVVSVLPEHGDA